MSRPDPSRSLVATDDIFVVTWRDGSNNSYYNRHFEQLPGTALGENMDGAVVGPLTVDDPDEGDSHVFTVDDPRFEIVGNQLRLKARESLDHESEPTVTMANDGRFAAACDAADDMNVDHFSQPWLRRGEIELLGGASAWRRHVRHEPLVLATCA